MAKQRTPQVVRCLGDWLILRRQSGRFGVYNDSPAHRGSRWQRDAHGAIQEWLTADRAEAWIQRQEGIHATP